MPYLRRTGRINRKAAMKKSVVLSFTYLVDIPNVNPAVDVEAAIVVAKELFRRELQSMVKVPLLSQKLTRAAVEKLFFERNERIAVYSLG